LIIVDTEAADSHDKTKSVSGVSELIPAIMMFMPPSSFFGFKPTDNQVHNDPIC